MHARFNIIVAIDGKSGIGKNGSIPWRNKQDFEHFSKKTTGNGNNAVIMGRKTYESLPSNFRPLPNRKNFVLSSQPITGVDTYTSLSTVLKECSQYNQVFIIGGQRLYEEAIKKYLYLCDNVYISHIPGDFGCDVFFPYLSLTSVEKIKREITSMDTFSLETITVKVIHPEQQYLDLLNTIHTHGEKKLDRTKVGTLSVFGPRLIFDLREGFPLLTTKNTWFNGIKKELVFFISGKTDTKILEEQGVNIWKGNTTSEFLSKNKLPWREGDMGPCFIADTPVLTNTGYKNIQDIIVGEHVYTHTGSWFPVEQIHTNSFTGNMVILDVKYHPNVITSTGDHPYYVRSFVVKDRYQNRRNVVIMNDPEFIPAKSLTKNHMIGFKIESVERIPQMILRKYQNKSVPDDVLVKSIVSYEEWYMLGYFLGDGWLVDEHNSNRIYDVSKAHFVNEQSVIYFSINKNQIDEIVPIISKVLDIQPCEDQGGSFRYRCRDIIWSQIMVQFGKYSHGKKIPDWVHTAPKDCIKSFLDGYRRADGCYRNYNKDIHRYTTLSRDIAYSIQRLYLKLGFIASLQFQQRGYKTIIPTRTNIEEQSYGTRSVNLFPLSQEDRLVNQRDVFFIEVYTLPKRRSNYSCIDNGYVWFTINDIIIQPVSDILTYNLTVTTDNTYTVCNLAVHNCYGFQWRHCGAEYKGCDHDYTGAGVDQLKNLINGIKNDPFGRRHIISSWDAPNIHLMALPPCHCFVQFNVGCDADSAPKYLDCCMYQRSADMFLGVPFNIASYSLLMCIIGHLTGLIPRKFIHDLGDAHIYSTHLSQVSEQIKRVPYPFPTLKFQRDIIDIDDIKPEDIVLENYCSHPKLTAEMAV